MADPCRATAKVWRPIGPRTPQRSSVRIVVPAPPVDLPLVSQVYGIEAIHNANGAHATGHDDLVTGDRAVSQWIARWLTKDPSIFIVLAVEGTTVSGAWVSQMTDGRTVEILTLNSTGRFSDFRRLGYATVDWAQARGATQIVGMTFRDPRVFSRATGAQHIHDLQIAEVT